MSDISERILSEIRSANISYGELASITGIPKAALQRYATGATEKIPINRLEQIAAALHTTAAYLMGWEEDEASQADELSRIDRIYQALNSDGQDELVRYGTYLTSQDVYRRDDSKPHVEYIKHYLVPAAAGYASPIEGEDYELIAKDPKAPVSADFCITISGDSMEPYIRDGELVYVKRDAALQDFDVGVFYVDGDVFCKQYTIDPFRNLYLLSANPKREDANITISRDSGRNVVCFGKVLLPKRLPRPIYI